MDISTVNSTGKLPSGKKSSFSIKLIVPVICNIISNIAGLEISPIRLSPGSNNIILTIEELSKDTLINGKFYILLLKDLKER